MSPMPPFRLERPFTNAKLRKFAQHAINEIMDIAFELTRTHGTGYGSLRSLVAELTSVFTRLDAFESSYLERDGKMEHLLQFLDALCRGKLHSEDFERLRVLVGTDLSTAEGMSARQQARTGLLRVMKNSEKLANAQKMVQSLLSKVKAADHQAGHNDNVNSWLPELPELADTSSDLDTIAYDVLRGHSDCSCEYGSPKHTVQLLLSPPDQSLPEVTGEYDLLLSSRITGERGGWRNVHLAVSKKQMVKFVHRGHDTQPRGTAQDIVPGNNICRVIVHSLNKQVRLAIEAEGLSAVHRMCYQVPDQDLEIEKFSGGTLADILELYEPTQTNRLVLAYALAYAVWRYYESYFSQSFWTSDAIVFMSEASKNEPTGGKIFASKPYLGVQFMTNNEGEKQEIMHDDPRRLALGFLLLEIVHPQEMKAVRSLQVSTGPSSLCAQWYQAKLLAEQPHSDFDHNVYWEAVRNCLESAAGKVLVGDTSSRTAEQRKATLYEKVVKPLRGLLVGSLGDKPISKIPPWCPRSWTTVDKTMVQQRHEAVQPTSEPKRGPTQQWFLDLHDINRQIYRPQPSSRRIRIAIIDTGCDMKSPLLKHDPRLSKRIIRRKNFVDNEAGSLTDDNGHGTCMVSLALQVAPEVEIYVARVSKGAEKEPASSRHVVEAIKWANETCAVDIISMSFGFTQRQSDIERAIAEAKVKRSVLFFAAAGNDRQACRWPARAMSVIAIRATDMNGQFVSGTPLRKDNEGWSFGALGVDVECYGPKKSEPRSGSSVATVIAASIAAILLDYVASHDPNATRYNEVAEMVHQHDGMTAILDEHFSDQGFEKYNCKSLRMRPILEKKGELDAVAWEDFVSVLRRYNHG